MDVWAMTSWKSWKKCWYCQLLTSSLSVWVKLSKDFTTFITNAELYKGDERFAKIEDGDTPFANNPFYEQAKEDIELLTGSG